MAGRYDIGSSAVEFGAFAASCKKYGDAIPNVERLNGTRGQRGMVLLSRHGSAERRLNGTCGQRGAVLLSLHGSAERCFSACILPAVVVV